MGTVSTCGPLYPLRWAGPQVAKGQGSSPVGTARVKSSKTVPEGNKNKPDSSQRGKEQSYPPGHPAYGKRNSAFFGGQGGGQRAPTTLVPLDDGMDFEFAVKMSFRHVREGERRLLPSHASVYAWIRAVAPEVDKIDVIDYCRDTQEVRVEYTAEEPCNKFQEMLLQGIRWGDSSDIVTGYRLDKPTTHVRLSGVNKKVSKSEVTLFMSQYGKVSAVYKKGIMRDMEEGKPGFVWDGVWQVHIRVWYYRLSYWLREVTGD